MLDGTGHKLLRGATVRRNSDAAGPGDTITNARAQRRGLACYGAAAHGRGSAGSAACAVQPVEAVCLNPILPFFSPPGKQLAVILERRYMSLIFLIFILNYFQARCKARHELHYILVC